MLRSLRFQPGRRDSSSTSLEYNASLNARARTRPSATVRASWSPTSHFPVRDPSRGRRDPRRGSRPRTRLALISHVTSPTASSCRSPNWSTSSTGAASTRSSTAPTAGHGPARPRRDRCRVLHGQRPQVVVGPEGFGVPPRPPRSAGRHPPAGDRPWGQRPRTDGRASGWSTTAGHARPDGVPGDGRRDHVHGLAPARRLARADGARTARSRSARAATSCARRSSVEPLAPTTWSERWWRCRCLDRGRPRACPSDASIGEALFKTFNIEVPIMEMPAQVDAGRRGR